MKNIVAILVSLMSFLFGGCTDSFVSQGNEEFAATISDSNVQLVDVRTAEEFADEHIPGAVNIDVKRDDFDELAAAGLDSGRPVAVYCRSGARSKVAAKRLAGKGFTVYELDNGFMNWDGPKEK
jgi:hypothetical protein